MLSLVDSGIAKGARVLVGRCFEQYMQVPFFPFSEALAAALAEAPGAFETEAVSRWPELSNLLPGSGHALTRLQDGAAHLQVFQAVAAFLRGLSSVEPLIVFLDDLHWADATSLALCVYLGRYLQGAPIVFLATYRDVELGRQHPLEDVLRELTRERVLDQLYVRRLTREDTAALERDRLQAQPASDQFLSLVYQHSEGNPFFTEELVDAFLEGSASDVRNNQSQLANLSEMKIPQSIRSALGQRVSRLAPAAQDLLHLASVIGPEFDLELLQQSSGLQDSELLEHLEPAVGARLLEERHTAARDTYAFTHILIQQTLYHELSRHRARRLHLRAPVRRLKGSTGAIPPLSVSWRGISTWRETTNVPFAMPWRLVTRPPLATHTPRRCPTMKSRWMSWRSTAMTCEPLSCVAVWQASCTT